VPPKGKVRVLLVRSAVGGSGESDGRTREGLESSEAMVGRNSGMLQFIALVTLGALGFSLYYQVLDKQDAEKRRADKPEETDD
jgi:hypothetical protein